MELTYTNAILLDIIQEHTDVYRGMRDDIVEVVIEGQTIGDNRVTTFQVVTPNDFDIHEHSETRTGDPIKIVQ